MDYSPLWISLKAAALSTCFNFFFGIWCAQAVLRLKRGRVLIDGILSLPLVLPPTVVGFTLLTFLGRNSLIGSILGKFGVRVIFTLPGAVIAMIAVSFPVMYRTVRGAFEQVDSELISVAKLLGCNRMRMLTHVWIPLSWPGIASGLTLAFARALGDFGATMMIAGNLPGKTRTMSMAVYTAVQSGNRQLAFQWTIVILVISLCILVSIGALMGRQFRKE